MSLVRLLLLSTALLNTKPCPVFTDVYVGDSGPYRFLVDTGSQTSLIDPKLAAELKLKPEFRVQVITQNSTRLLPALKVRTLRIGQTQLAEAELVFHDLAEARRLDASVSGVLGINALKDLDFELRPKTGRFEVTTARPAGASVPIYRVEDRIAIKARMGREELTLILDSGTTHIVLFRTPAAMAKSPALPTTYGTLEGARTAAATCWTADMAITNGLKFGTLPAAIVSRPGAKVDGLIPASLFKSIYVDQARSEIVLTR